MIIRLFFGGLYFFISSSLVFTVFSFPLHTPKPDAVGNIPTLNEMGVMCIHEGWLYSRYLHDIKPGECVLDIGCAYGHTVIKAAQKGAFVLANDLSSDQLDILKETVKNEPFRDNITYQASNFLAQSYASNTYDRILIASVLHFMDPADIQAALTKIAAILKPGGKVYILTASPLPYLKISDAFKKDYTQKKNQGDEWPGFFTDTSRVLPQLKGTIPEKCTFSDLDTLIKVVEKSGLLIIHGKYDASSYEPAKKNVGAQDFINIIAEKPHPPS